MSIKARYLPYVAVSQRRTSQRGEARRTSHAGMQSERRRGNPLRRWWQTLVQIIGGAYR